MSTFFDELRRAFGQHVPGPTRHYSDFPEEEKAKYRASSPSPVEAMVNLSQFPEATFAPKLNEGERMARMRAIPIEYDDYVVDKNGKEKAITRTGYVAVDEQDIANNDYLQGLVFGNGGSRIGDTGKIGVYSLILGDESKYGQDAMNAIDALRNKNLRVATQRAPYRGSASDAVKKLYYDRSYPYLYENDDYDRYSYRGGNSNGNWRSIPGAVDEFINRYRDLQ